MTTYYVATTGSDAVAGSLAAPFATLAHAAGIANPGDTIYMRGGTYALTDSGVQISRSGSSGNYINVFNYPGETPILDGINITTSSHSAIQLTDVSWWHFQGLEIKNAGASGIYLAGVSSHNIVEFCHLHHNSRIQTSGAGGITVQSGSDNLILNNDSHHHGIYGSTGGDGIGVGSLLTGNIVRGNRVWRNNDDGIDLWDANGVLVENNWSWENGKKDDLTPSGGNGDGFKLGGGDAGDGNHIIRNNLAWRNQHNGFDDNSANLPMNVFNNTGYENATNFSFWDPVAFVLKNNLSLPNSSVYIPATQVVQSNNSWNLGVTVDSTDFQSLDYSGATGPRNADGSLPTLNFLKLVAGSDLIDKGVDVGLPYSGSAPDLGAYEYASPVDTTAPTVPTGFTATAVSSSQINLSWNASTDAVGVAGYKVYRGGSLITTTVGTTYQNAGLAASTLYSYAVAAFDAAGNLSAQSASASATTQAIADVTPPTIPTGLTAAAISSSQINLSWSASTDNVGVTGYKIYRGGSQIATTAGTTYSDTGLTPSTLYAYNVAAYDAAANASVQSAVSSATTNAVAGDTTPPTASITSPSGGTVSGIVVVSVNASDNVGVARVDLLVNGIFASSVPWAPYQLSWDSTSVANGSVQLRANAYDLAGNLGQSSIVTVTVLNVIPDTTPPVISNVGVASNQHGNVTIVWTTDELSDSAVSYSTTAGVLATPQQLPPTFVNALTTGNSALVTSHSVGLIGAMKNATYYYRVFSSDASGNQSISSIYSFKAKP